MGLSGDLLKWLRKSIVPSAFSAKFPDEIKEYILIDDVLTRIRITSSGNEIGLTGEQFFQAFQKPILQELANGHCKVYIVCCDIRGRVPPQKNAEQKKRDEAARKAGKTNTYQAYHEDCEITDAGIVPPNDHKYPGVDKPELIDVNKLAGSRGLLREKMMNYLGSKLQ
jgi:hypothetical protein